MSSRISSILHGRLNSGHVTSVGNDFLLSLYSANKRGFDDFFMAERLAPAPVRAIVLFPVVSQIHERSATFWKFHEYDIIATTMTFRTQSAALSKMLASSFNTLQPNSRTIGEE